MSRAWKGGSTRRWRRLRALILATNQLQHCGHCQLQLPAVCTGQATTVHHTRGKAVTGDDPRYLTASCAACNLYIGEPGRHDPTPRPMTRW